MTSPGESPPRRSGSDGSEWHNSIRLYDTFAPDFDASFEAPDHRKAYDLLAWEYLSRLLPPSSGIVVDAGCGTGRWVERLLARGHRVIGIEHAPEMVNVLKGKNFGPAFTLIAEDMESARLEPQSVDVVMAMASVQYTRNPAEMIRRFASWTKPGGAVCVMVDSLVALVLELIRMNKKEEALLRLRTGRGVFRVGSERADLHLHDSRTLVSYFVDAGLADIACHGLPVTSSVWGREGCAQAMATDEAAFLDLERELSRFSVMADAGKHILVSGRRPR